MNTLANETVRLVEGPNSREGRVEVFYSGVWGEVCGAHWDVSDANVVCRSLGYGGASTFRVNITIIKQENDTVWLTGVRCIGNETSLSQCPHDGWGERTCSGNQAAGVTCFEQAKPQFISSSLDTITMKYHVPGVTQISYTVQIWSNNTKKWRDARCIQSTVKDLCVVTNLSRSVTVTGLSPGHAYFVRFSSPTQVFSQVSEPIETKKLGFPVEPRFVSRSRNSITLTWTSTNSMLTNYTVEMRCCKETLWVEAHCTDNLIGRGCTVNDTTTKVIGLKENKEYYFRVYAVYNNWRSAASSSSVAIKTILEDKKFSPYGVWISPWTPGCVTSEKGHVITLFCLVPSTTLTVYEWTKGERVLSNGSTSGILNVSISSSVDFGVYTCHAVDKYGVTSYNITVCQNTGHVETVTEDYNRVAIAVITTCFICFATFIVVLILLKMARIHRRRKKQQSLDLATGREEMAMLNYRQKTSRSGNNNEEDLD